MLFKNYFIRGNNNSTDLEKATTNNAHSSNHDALKIIKKLLKLLEQKQETIDEIKKERMARPLKELDPPKKGASDFEVAVYRQQSTIKTFMSKHGMSYDDLSAAIEWPKSKLMPFMHIKSTRVRAGKRELRPAQLFTIEDLIYLRNCDWQVEPSPISRPLNWVQMITGEEKTNYERFLEAKLKDAYQEIADLKSRKFD